MMKKNNILKNNLNLILAGIITFGAILRFYFFNLTKNQAHWWDSLAYGSLAKNLISHRWDQSPFILHESIIRPPLFPLIWSGLLRIGASDATVIFLTGVIPSIISIFLVYLIGKEMYTKKVGLVAASFASVSWISLFYSTRALTDVPSMCLILASIYFFIKGHESINVKQWAMSVAFLSIAVMFRYSYAIFAFVYVIFLFFAHKTSLLKKKYFWVGGVLGATPLIIFILINLVSYGSLLPATSEYASSASEKGAFAWYTIGFIAYILKTPLVYVFYSGLAIIFFKTVMAYGFISKSKELRMHLFNILLLVLVVSFYIFIIKASEDRYLLGLSGTFFLVSAISISYIFNYLSKYRKEIALIACFALILWSMYGQVYFANNLIISKKESFIQMKDAYQWINQNTPRDSVITGDWAEPYGIFYADRKLQELPSDLNFTNFNLEADYIILTAVHQPNEKVVGYVNQLTQEGKVAPIKVFFFDAEQKQPAVIIYRRNI